MNINEAIISQFGAVRVPKTFAESDTPATLVDLVALATDFGFAFDASVLHVMENLSPGQRGTLFLDLGSAFKRLCAGYAVGTSPLYRAFPNHKVVPIEMRVVLYMLDLVGFKFDYDRNLYGANPVTGFQEEGGDALPDEDGEFRIPLELDKSQRVFTMLKLATDEFVSAKSCALLENFTPLNGVELFIVRWAIETGEIDHDDLANIGFREKLPLVYETMSTEEYAKSCNSVTDVLRLAVWMSDTDENSIADLSLASDPRFNLKKSQAKRLLRILELILEFGSTDFETDFLRHEERWKRFATHIRSRGFEKQFPLSVQALASVRSGEMSSWEQKYAAADLEGKINLAVYRPGVLMRRMTALGRLVEASGSKEKADLLVAAATKCFPSVDTLKLVQLLVHLERTNTVSRRFHLLPSGSIMSSEAKPIDMSYISRPLREHLHARLKNVVVGSNTDDLKNLFIPAGNRSASAGKTRNAKGDRINIGFAKEDTLRMFLHWHHPCDVDLSASFFDDNFSNQGDCTYFNLYSGEYAAHSGDIRDGRNGAAEYIDINVEKARDAGVRYVLMTSNVYSGDHFNSFDCSVGIMVRDGETGDHFEASTVRSKLDLDSDSRMTNPAIFDLETGSMIYVDLHGDWREGHNVASKRASLSDVMEYFVNFDLYRATFADVIQFTEDPSSIALSADKLKESQDEILRALADA